MHTATGKIGLLILTIILMPVLIFSFFEIGGLKQNERVVHEIYTNQLDAILFSINQYSDDVISDLAGKIENTTETGSENPSALQGILSEFPSVMGILKYDRAQRQLLFAYPEETDISNFGEILESNDSLLIRLQAYLEGGYRKIESLTAHENGVRNIIYATSTDDQVTFTILIIDARKFINELLDPKIQEIARGSFDIVAYENGDPVPFYSSEKQYIPERAYETRPFWLLENYNMGIQLHETTISELARSRSLRNILLVALADIVLFAGAWLVYRNIVRQIELSKLKSDFVSNVSHEIRTPVSLIRMSAETLEMGRIKDQDKIREYHSLILKETIRLSNIVNRILVFSRIESKRHRYNLQLSDINEITGKAMQDMKHILESSGFLHYFLPGKNLPLILADREAVTDALVNLLDNAMKYSNGDKHIIIRTGLLNDFVYVEVEDHGIGIPEKYQHQIFDKFFRISEKDIAFKTKGSGLGLSIVKHITESHGGNVFVKSTPGEGSLFRLLFPVPSDNKA